MDLKMEIYTPLLELVGILEVHRSVIWDEKAFGAGSFSVDSLITDESKALLIPGNIIWISDNYAGIIEYVQEQSGKEGPYITVKGPDLTGILGQRILWGQYNLTGTAPAIMHSLVNDSCISPTRGDTEARKIPGLVSLDVPTGGDAIRVQKTGGTLLEALEELGAAFGVAFGVRFNPAIPRMEFWTRWGQNRGINQDVNDPVFYSTELDDVLSSEYSYNAQDYRNVALVAGEGDGKNRAMVTVVKNGQPSEQAAVEFMALGDSSAMRTADSKAFKTIALSEDGESYQSAYTGPQIDEAIQKALSGGTVGPQGPKGDKGDPGPQGPKGDKGDPGDGSAEIEEYDTDDGWHVRKWDSGYIEMSIKLLKNVSSSLWKSWGTALFHCGNDVFGHIPYPVTLTKNYGEFVSAIQNGWGFFVAPTGQFNTDYLIQSNAYLLARPTKPSSDILVGIYIFVIGAWK